MKKAVPSLIQKGLNMGLSTRTTINQAIIYTKADKKRVCFLAKMATAESYHGSILIIVAYSSGAGVNYLG